MHRNQGRDGNAVLSLLVLTLQVFLPPTQSTSSETSFHTGNVLFKDGTYGHVVHCLRPIRSNITDGDIVASVWTCHFGHFNNLLFTLVYRYIESFPICWQPINVKVF